LLPAFAGQELIVRTWVANFHKISSLRKYQILRAADQVRLAIAETNWVFFGLEHRVPRRVPPELVAAFEIVEGDPT
jgi:acyl-CoA thioester hydrolase